MVSRLKQAGFSDVIILDATECGYDEFCSLLLAVWPYEAEETPASEGAWIHPYYPASQQAYRHAAQIASDFADEGITLRNDIRVKPIFARLPGFSQGRNTLSYLAGIGSRFHVQIFASTGMLPATHHLTKEAQPLHCQECRRCEAACPANALEGGVFHRDRCLRNWMLSGQPVPVEVRELMGNRLLGCDDCQRCCPHNPAPKGKAEVPISLHETLESAKQLAERLKPLIGANLSIPNRLLAQACLNAGCSGDTSLIPLLEPLIIHPSAVVREHASWAISQLRSQ